MNNMFEQIPDNTEYVLRESEWSYPTLSLCYHNGEIIAFDKVHENIVKSTKQKTMLLIVKKIVAL